MYTFACESVAYMIKVWDVATQLRYDKRKLLLKSNKHDITLGAQLCLW